MGRSFYRAGSWNTEKISYYHQASDSWFTMEQRGGEYFQGRYQLDSANRKINIIEKRVDYVMGSGNRSRAFLNRTERGLLVELPLAWYSENGGSWGMNPGYDRPDHEGFRRTITYDCMFCHNAYPAIPAAGEKAFAEPIYTGSLPEGIDCQRCHGPGARHAQLARTAGARKDDIRKAILNPARLSAERQMEVCMQCHLEPTSFPLPNTIQRYERGPFSYSPGERLGNFLLTFDHAPGTGRENKFELVSAAYRLRQSKCFLMSSGALTCTACHNPHDIPRGEAAARQYNAVCGKCHAAVTKLTASGTHPSGSCIACHMPKRRTEDVVHVSVTDHLIQRRPPAGDLLAERPERHDTEATAYRGKVVPYYPANPPDLYLAIAQVIQQSNLKEGIPQLTAAIAKYAPKRPEYDLQLAEAWRSAGDLNKAIPFYEKALRKDPKFVFGMQELAAALRRTGRPEEAVTRLKQAVALAPDNPVTWRELGLSYRASGHPTEAIEALRKAIALDPDMSEAHNNLGVIRREQGDPTRAEAAFREAIRIQPDYADAHANLAGLLSEAGDLTEAARHFERSLQFRPNDAPTHYAYALLLGKARRFDGAQRELEASLKDDPQFADAHELMGDLLMAREQTAEAMAHYREAVRIRPGSARNHLRLGTALLATGNKTEAAEQLQKAAAGSEATVREEAAQLLRKLAK
jgi:predicted CXXCH cytochrome family protein